MHRYTQNLPRLTLNADFHRATANLAVNREALKRDTCIHCGLECLTAKRAMNGLNCFHALSGNPRKQPRFWIVSFRIATLKPSLLA